MALSPVFPFIVDAHERKAFTAALHCFSQSVRRCGARVNMKSAPQRLTLTCVRLFFRRSHVSLHILTGRKRLSAIDCFAQLELNPRRRFSHFFFPHPRKGFRFRFCNPSCNQFEGSVMIRYSALSNWILIELLGRTFNVMNLRHNGLFSYGERETRISGRNHLLMYYLS